jgi:DNA replication protein DnaC
MAQLSKDSQESHTYNCKSCRDTGMIMSVVDGREVCKPCDCYYKDLNAERIKQSGLEGLIDKCTFENFDKSNDFRYQIVKRAWNNTKVDNWFFMGGQRGCGKTHLCTAIMNEMLKQNKKIKYMMWIEDSVTLKNIMYDNPSEYNGQMNMLKNADVLYIDDLFKTKGTNNAIVSDADVRLAFTIINSRYINNKKTLFSTEKSMEQIMDIDDAIGSRIYEMCDESFMICIPDDDSKNYRDIHNR